jgi:hypothetical protein
MPLIPEAVAAALAAGSLSTLVTTPLWLRARHRAVVLRAHAAVAAADLLAARCRGEGLAAHSLAVAAETRYLVDVRVPATVGRLDDPRLPAAPGLLHPRFAGTALEADHLALLDQLTAAIVRDRLRRNTPAQGSDPGPGRGADGGHPSAADWFQPKSRPRTTHDQQPRQPGPFGSSVVWSAFQSGTESGRAPDDTRYERSH